VAPEDAAWLDEFALFMALKQAHNNVMWTFWDRELALRGANNARALLEAVTGTVIAAPYGPNGASGSLGSRGVLSPPALLDRDA